MRRLPFELIPLAFILTMPGERISPRVSVSIGPDQRPPWVSQEFPPQPPAITPVPTPVPELLTPTPEPNLSDGPVKIDYVALDKSRGFEVVKVRVGEKTMEFIEPSEPGVRTLTLARMARLERYATKGGVILRTDNGGEPHLVGVDGLVLDPVPHLLSFNSVVVTADGKMFFVVETDNQRYYAGLDNPYYRLAQVDPDQAQLVAKFLRGRYPPGFFRDPESQTAKFPAPERAGALDPVIDVTFFWNSRGLPPNVFSMQPVGVDAYTGQVIYEDSAVRVRINYYRPGDGVGKPYIPIQPY